MKRYAASNDKYKASLADILWFDTYVYSDIITVKFLSAKNGFK